MLATLPAPAMLSFRRPVRIRRHVPTIKVLDLLTNRYYTGVLSGEGEVGLQLEMPLSARLRAGQRIRFIVARPEDGCVVSREAMQGGVVTRVDLGDANRLRVQVRADLVFAGA